MKMGTLKSTQHQITAVSLSHILEWHIFHLLYSTSLVYHGNTFLTQAIQHNLWTDFWELLSMTISKVYWWHLILYMSKCNEQIWFSCQSWFSKHQKHWITVVFVMSYVYKHYDLRLLSDSNIQWLQEAWGNVIFINTHSMSHIPSYH